MQQNMETLSVSGLEELVHTLGVRKGDVYILFCGDSSEYTGQSWCPDCVKGMVSGYRLTLTGNS